MLREREPSTESKDPYRVIDTACHRGGAQGSFDFVAVRFAGVNSAQDDIVI